MADPSCEGQKNTPSIYFFEGSTHTPLIARLVKYVFLQFPATQHKQQVRRQAGGRKKALNTAQGQMLGCLTAMRTVAPGQRPRGARSLRERCFEAPEHTSLK